MVVLAFVVGVGMVLGGFSAVEQAAAVPDAAAGSSARLQEVSQPQEPTEDTSKKLLVKVQHEGPLPGRRPVHRRHGARVRAVALDRTVGDEGVAQRRAADRAGARRASARSSAGLIARSPLALPVGAALGFALPFVVPQVQAHAAHARVRRAVPRGARPDLARAEGRPRVRDRAEDGRRRDARPGRSRVPQDVRRAELRSAAEGRARQPDRPRCRRSTCGSSPPPC